MADNRKEQERDELHRAIWAIADDIDVQFYNLDAIISVGYRVNFRKATFRNFRIVQSAGGFV